MAYVALYRQWRPQRFEDVVGQVHISKTLKNAIKNSRIVHAYLFSGPRGTGKTSSAKILAKAVNCLNPVDGEACNECTSCRLITQGNSMDIIEIDAASNRGIDEIRDLREKVKYAPVESRYKVYIIDEVHMLTTEAFNALLKTLEEPPKHVIFILATTEPHKVPITVLSRCQRFDFKRIGYRDIVGRLEEIASFDRLKINERAMQIIAKKAEGSMRDALSLLDQTLSFTEGEITEDILAQILGTVDASFMQAAVMAIAEKDLASLLKRVDELVNEGKDLRQFLHDLVEYFRNLLLVKLSRNGEIPGSVPDYLYEAMRKESALFQAGQLFSAIQCLGEAESQLKFSSQPRISLEISLIKAAGFKEETPHQILETKTVDAPSHKEAAPKIAAPSQVKGYGESGLINIKTVKEQWKKVLEGVRRQRPSTYAYLVEGEPNDVNGNKIMLLYKPNFQLHMQNLDLPANKAVIEKILFAVFEQRLSVQGFLAAGEQKDDIAVKAKELFGEDVVEIKG